MKKMLQELEQKSDEELMLAYQAGHEDAFHTLYGRYSSKVYGFLVAKLRDRATADDAFQATFLKLHQNRDKYDSALPFTPWLFTVCRSAMIDTLRSRKRHTQLEELNPVAVENAVADSPLEVPALPHHLQVPVQMQALPETQRQALELRYLQDLSFDEIARRLGTSSENSRQLVSRAVKKLRKLVQGNGEDA